MRRHGGDDNTDNNNNNKNSNGLAQPRRRDADDDADDAAYEAMSSAAEQLRELHEANAALVSELTQLRLSQELLQSRLASIDGRHARERDEWRVQTRELRRHEAVGHALLARQKERADFLESQVRSLRGYSVSPDTSLTSLEANENVFELFLGQLVASPSYAGRLRHPPPANANHANANEWFAEPLFCSVDFMLHETVTTSTVMGLGGFFDTTIAFRMAMNPLLLYYLQTRQLIVQLHRVHADGTHTRVTHTTSAVIDADENDKEEKEEGGNSTDARLQPSPSANETETVMYDTVAEGRVSLLPLVTDRTQWRSGRPAVRGHVRLMDSNRVHCASLEFQLTARLPFDEAFGALLQSAAADMEKSAEYDTIHEEATDNDNTAPRVPTSIHPPPPPRVLFTTPTQANQGESTWQTRTRSAAASSVTRSRRQTESSLPPRPDTAATWSLTPAHSPHTDHSSMLSSTATASEIPEEEEEYNNRHGSAGGRSSGHIELTRHGTESHRNHTWQHQQHHSHENIAPQPRASMSSAPSRLYRAASSPLSSSRSDAGVHVTAGSPIRLVGVDVVRVELSAMPSHRRRDTERIKSDVTRFLPRLSCYYTLPGWKEESAAVYLRAPARAQFTVEYDQPAAVRQPREAHNGNYQRSVAEEEEAAARVGAHMGGGTAFVVRSRAQLLTLAREPLVFFFVDEDNSEELDERDRERDGGAARARSTQANAPSRAPERVWAMAACEFAPALRTPNVAVEVDLPLMRQRAAVAGAWVRVRLWAYTQEEEEVLAGLGQPQQDRRLTDMSHNTTVTRDRDVYPAKNTPTTLSTPALSLSLEEEMMRVGYENGQTQTHASQS